MLFGGGRRGGGEGEEKCEAREGLVYVTFSGRVDICRLVGWEDWEEDRGGEV